MSTPTYHVLNGDALAERFPTVLTGERIIFRECLIEGPTRGATPQALYPLRAAFMQYAGYISDQDEYREKTISELEKLDALPAGAAVYLWFERDLFCQANLWYAVYQLAEAGHTALHLVQPRGNNFKLGFAGENIPGLQQCFQQATLLEPLATWQQFWPGYATEAHELLKQLAQALAKRHPFLPAVVEAHAQRFTQDDSLGRPQQLLKEIAQELGTHEFGPIFRVFCERADIYGFGDLQVLRLYRQLFPQA